MPELVKDHDAEDGRRTPRPRSSLLLRDHAASGWARRAQALRLPAGIAPLDPNWPT